jgi:hypothetical protein
VNAGAHVSADEGLFRSPVTEASSVSQCQVERVRHDMDLQLSKLNYLIWIITERRFQVNLDLWLSKKALHSDREILVAINRARLMDGGENI